MWRFWIFKRPVPRERMPMKFEYLAHYNSEVQRGIVHTPETIDTMKCLQQEYNEWIWNRK